MIKDTKFILQLSMLTLFIAVALSVLSLVSKPKKFASSKKNRESFLVKLSQLELDINNIEFKQVIKPQQVVVVEKEIIKKVKVPVEVVRNSVNKDIKPAQEISIDLNTKPVKVVKNKTNLYNKLKKQFHNTHDYKLALKISRLYYFSKKYKSSLKWAMIANEINQKDDSSWIMFAKTKLKLGDKKNAKKALLIYNRTYYSQKVEDMLNRIDS